MGRTRKVWGRTRYKVGANAIGSESGGYLFKLLPIERSYEKCDCRDDKCTLRWLNTRLVIFLGFLWTKMRSKYTRSQHRTSPIDSYISIELGRQMIYYMTKILFDLKILHYHEKRGRAGAGKTAPRAKLVI